MCIHRRCLAHGQGPTCIMPICGCRCDMSMRDDSLTWGMLPARIHTCCAGRVARQTPCPRTHKARALLLPPSLLNDRHPWLPGAFPTKINKHLSCPFGHSSEGTGHRDVSRRGQIPNCLRRRNGKATEGHVGARPYFSRSERC